MTYRLPIEKILVEAVRLPWRERRAYLRGLMVPGGALIGFYTAWWSFAGSTMNAWESWTLWIGSWLLVMFFAIACHRLALLEEVRRSPELFPPLDRRELLFALRGIGLGVIYLFVQWVVLLVISMPGPSLDGPATVDWVGGFWMKWIPYIVAMYVFSRFSLVFPATAIDEKTSFGDAWSRSRRNGWRMLVVVGGAPAIMTYATDWLYGEASNTGAAIAASAVIAVFLAVEITALSLSYRALTPPPPREPPG